MRFVFRQFYKLRQDVIFINCCVNYKDMKIWIDGSGWNERESKYAIAFEDGENIIERFKEKKTNNEMEYMALLRALDYAKDGDTILTDSSLVVNQMNGKWKIKKPHLFKLVMQAKAKIGDKKITIKWVGRDKNYAGALLEK